MIYRLEHKEYLIALLIIPLLVGAWWFFQWNVAQRVKKLGEKPVLKAIMPGLSKNYVLVKYTLLVLAVLFLIIGLINPQTGSESFSSRTVGLEVNLVLDVSNSMLAQDVKPSRMEAARKVVYKLVNGLKSDKIGITIFAGEAFNQLPPTSDENVLDAVIASLSPESIPTQGSNLYQALDIGMHNFNKNYEQQKILIFISDGESHEERFLDKAKEAGERNIVIYAIGIGTARGAAIPIVLPNGRKAYLKDPQGKVVKTTLNESSLAALMQSGRGFYTNVNDEAGINRIINSINNVKRKVVTEKISSQFTSYFPYFIAVALSLILLEFFMPKVRVVKNDIDL